MSSPGGIAIAGLGCLCGAGMNLPECLESMYRGERNPQPPQHFVTDHPVKYPVLELPRPLEVPLDRPATEYTRTSRLALAAALEALADAGFDKDSLRGLRVGVCVGTTVGCALNCDDFYRAYKHGDDPGMGIIERFLRSNLYRHYRVHRMTAKASRTISALFEAFINDPRLLPDEAQEKVRQLEEEQGDAGRARAVADYIAGMTDRYAIAEYDRTFNPSI